MSSDTRGFLLGQNWKNRCFYPNLLSMRQFPLAYMHADHDDNTGKNIIDKIKFIERIREFFARGYRLDCRIIGYEDAETENEYIGAGFYNAENRLEAWLFHHQKPDNKTKNIVSVFPARMRIEERHTNIPTECKIEYQEYRGTEVDPFQNLR